MYRLLIIFLLFCQGVFAQDITQIVRGVLVDKASRDPLIGATVVLLDSTSRIASSTDMYGRFRLEKVPLGRQNIRFSSLGYADIVIPVVVSSAKEVIINAELEQKMIESQEVVVIGERDKSRANNDMTTVSSRSFTIEETQRYAGSRNDPARMAANYAGVSGANDARNDIIIRGNSPIGVLWRLNGIDIPNPNHFGALGTTGGPIGILNNNQLDKSDFLTGAFPAEYGNALGGVFDLQLRSGNNEKREYLGQLGFNGFELGAEGPFAKGRGAYLVNYRYSTLTVFNKLGIDFGAGSAVPQYQDISFKVDLPLDPKYGKLSVFGIGGISYVELLESKKDSSKKDLFSRGSQDTYYGTNMGVAGISHTYFFSGRSYGRLSLSVSGSQNLTRVDSLGRQDKKPYPFYGNRFSQVKYSVNYTLYTKFDAKNFLKSGFTVDLLRFTLKDSVLRSYGFRRITDFVGGSALVQAYTQWQHKFSDRLILNTGLHYQQFLLNSRLSLEPRAGIRYSFRDNQSLGFATGLHSQLQPIYLYFVQTRLSDGSYAKTNQQLDFTKSIHYVLSYDRTFGKDKRIKAELYYQQLYNVPVEMRHSYYSVLNEGADFGFSSTDSLVNSGTGQNYGVEFTFEKFYSQNYYLLFTGSLFNSRYKGSDGVDRNTAFNGNYTVNILAGKEFVFRKRNVLSLNGKLSMAGGKRYIPIDISRSMKYGDAEYDYSRAYENQYSGYFRADIKISYKRNGRRTTQEWSLNIDNVLNTKNIFIQRYDPLSRTVKTEYQVGFFPIPQYRIEF